MCLLCCSFSQGAVTEDISHECVIPTMLLEVVLAIVFPFAVATADTATNHKAAPLLSYNGTSLPREHLPYFLNNNKKLSKQCRSDPLCPFQVSCVL